MAPQNSSGVTISWTVENLSYCTRMKVSSPAFLIEFLHNTKWKLALGIKPSGMNDQIFFALRRKATDGESIQLGALSFEISIFAASGSLLFSEQKSNVHIGENETSGWRKNETRESIFGDVEDTGFWPKDDLTMRCRLWDPSSPNSGGGIFSARSQIVVERKTSIWPIERYSVFCRQAEERSVRVTFDSNKLSSLVMKLCSALDTCCSNGECDEPVHMEISKCMEISKNPVCITLNLTALNSANGTLMSSRGQVRLNQKAWRFPLFFLGEGFDRDMEKFLKNDTLLLEYDLIVSVGNIVHEIQHIGEGLKLDLPTTPVDDNPIGCVAPTATLNEDLCQLLGNQDLSDFKIHVGDKVFSVHKIMLGARSPFFKAMFSSDMRENLTGSMDITNLEVDTVRQMLLFMYTDTIKSLDWASATKLFEAGDQFDIAPLRKVCAIHLKANLCLANVFDLLSFAVTHSDEHLMKTVQEFILQYERPIFSSEQWKVFAAENKDVALQTLQLKYTKD